MNVADVMKQLKKDAGFYEIYHKTSFWGYRNKANEESQEVSVDILDRGSEVGDQRYSCVATTSDGKMATGNNYPSVDLAISGVHWYDLDKELDI